MTEGYDSVVHWLTKKEACEKQELITVWEGHSAHADPTAYAAIGRAIRTSDRKQLEQSKRKPSRRPRTLVWRFDEVK